MQKSKFAIRACLTASSQPIIQKEKYIPLINKNEEKGKKIVKIYLKWPYLEEFGHSTAHIFLNIRRHSPDSLSACALHRLPLFCLQIHHLLCPIDSLFSRESFAVLRKLSSSVSLCQLNRSQATQSLRPGFSPTLFPSSYSSLGFDGFSNEKPPKSDTGLQIPWTNQKRKKPRKKLARV